MLEDLYQELILDHNKSPHHYGKPSLCNHHAEGHNPLCGDQISIFLNIQDNHIQDVGFTGQGCAIAKSSASIMTDALLGKSILEAQKLFEKFHALLTDTDPSTEATFTDSESKLLVFSGVKQYPIRVKCATLAWHTLHAALNQNSHQVTTE